MKLHQLCARLQGSINSQELALITTRPADGSIDTATWLLMSHIAELKQTLADVKEYILEANHGT